MRRAFRTLAIATTASTVLLIAWGGVVRATGSGDGCPDWPTCFGSWVPRVEYHTLIEYFHRLLAVVSATLSIALAVVGAWSLARSRGDREDRAVPRLAAWLAVGLAPLFIIQAAIGGVDHRDARRPCGRDAPFPAVAFVVLGVAVAITVLAHLLEPGGVRSYARITAITALATYALLLVGGTYVRAEGAGLAFRDWPLMSGRLIPISPGRGRDRCRAPAPRDRRHCLGGLVHGASPHDAAALREARRAVDAGAGAGDRADRRRRAQRRHGSS